jgi:hypothetical protein
MPIIIVVNVKLSIVNGVLFASSHDEFTRQNETYVRNDAEFSEKKRMMRIRRTIRGRFGWPSMSDAAG